MDTPEFDMARFFAKLDEANIPRRALPDLLNVTPVAIWNWQKKSTNPQKATRERMLKLLTKVETGLVTGTFPLCGGVGLEEVVAALRSVKL